MQQNARESLIRRARWYRTALIAAAGVGTAAVATTAYAATATSSTPSQQQPITSDEGKSDDGPDGGGILPWIGGNGIQSSPGGPSDGGSHSS